MRIGNIFSKSGRYATGVSLGSSAIKIVELQRSSNSWQLLHFGIVQLPEDAILNRDIVNHLAVVDKMRALVSEIRLNQRSVCTSVSGNGVIIKRLNIEIENKNELDEQVSWEAEHYLPFDPSEVYLDYSVVSESSAGVADVILVAVKQSLMDSYVGCIEDAGLKVEVLDIDFFALQNVYEANYTPQSGQAVCLVDIGAASTKMVVVFNGIPIFTKESAIGGMTLTREIEKTLSLSYSDAEAIKVGSQSGSGGPQEVKELINIMNENISSEIRRTIDFYSASSSGGPVSQILITGGGSKLDGLVNTVGAVTEISTSHLNPFVNVSYDSSRFSSEEIQSIAPLASICVGQALRQGEQ